MSDWSEAPRTELRWFQREDQKMRLGRPPKRHFIVKYSRRFFVCLCTVTIFLLLTNDSYGVVININARVLVTCNFV